MRALALVVLALTACGGGDDGDPITGTVQGSFDGTAFTPKFGFATLLDGAPVIGLGTDTIHCGSENTSSPPSGHGIIISGFQYATGANANASVQVFESSGGSYSSNGSDGTLTLTDVNDASITGTVDFDFTNSDAETYSAHGDFVVVHCAE